MALDAGNSSIVCSRLGEHLLGVRHTSIPGAGVRIRTGRGIFFICFQLDGRRHSVANIAVLLCFTFLFSLRTNVNNLH